MVNTDLPPTAEEIEAKEKELEAQLEKETSSEELTPEEIQAQKDKEAQEKLDADEAEAARLKAEKIANGEEEAEEEEQEETEEKETEEEEKPEEKKEEVDYKKKFTESSREAQAIATIKKKQDEELQLAQSIPEPTDEQVRAEVEAQGEDYDSLSVFFKNIAKTNLHNKLKNEAVEAILEKQRETKEKIEARKKEVDVYSILPETLKKFPRLEGRQEEFNKYASMPKRLSLDLEDLAKLFLLDLPEPEKHKGKMFETGNGGKAPEKKKNGGKLSIAEGAALMQKDYALYQQYLMAGKISDDVNEG